MLERTIRKSMAPISAALLLCASLLTLAACSQGLTIGTESSDALKISVKNETGEAISGIGVDNPYDAGPVEALKQLTAWANGVTAEVYIDPSSLQAPDANSTQPLMGLEFVTADNMTYVIPDLNFYDIEDATLSIDDGKAYLVYKSSETGEEVNTLDAP